MIYRSISYDICTAHEQLFIISFRNQESMLSTHMKKMESEEKKSTGPKESFS